MLTKQDFMNAALANIDQYPTLAALQRVGDPRIEQHLGAVATMLSMMSQQMEAATMEAFSKTRPATILADAAMRGIIPRADGVRVALLAENSGDAAVVLAQGRVLLDAAGNSYLVESPASVASQGRASVIVRQGEVKTITHTVQDTIPFYAIEVPPSEDGSYLSTITVHDASGALDWSTEYTNIMPGDRVYHVEVDERQRVYVRFGYQDVVGVQPQNGDTITLTIGYAMGDMTPQAQSQFALDYVNPAEAGLTLTMDAIVQRGKDPIGLDALRDFARYPSIYSDSAVFMGEFDYLVRKKFQPLAFASVWNEAQEEAVRGASVDNINALYVAVCGTDMREPVLLQPSDVSIAPTRIPEAQLTELQKQVRKAILFADDSYRIYFVTPVQCHVGVEVSARVAPSYVPTDVQAQIRRAILENYGAGSSQSSRGYNRPLHQRIYALLRASVPALKGDGEADWTVKINMPQDWGKRPELWMFVSEESLSVSVETANIVQPTWGV